METETLTDTMIEAALAGANASGDLDFAHTCKRALGGCEAARIIVADVISALREAACEDAYDAGKPIPFVQVVS